MERRDEGRDAKSSKGPSKTVAFRLQRKLMERGRTPNLNANFYAKAYLHT